MSEQPNATDPKDSTVPCEKCGSTIHTTGHHDGGAPAERTNDGGMSPMGHHDGGITAETAKTGGGMSPMGHHDGGIAAEKPAAVATGHHDGGNPNRK